MEIKLLLDSELDKIYMQRKEAIQFAIFWTKSRNILVVCQNNARKFSSIFFISHQDTYIVTTGETILFDFVDLAINHSNELSME